MRRVVSLILTVWFGGFPASTTAETSLSPLTTCRQVRDLERPESLRQLPVDLTGTVTHITERTSSPGIAKFSLVLVDETDAVYVSAFLEPSEGFPLLESGVQPVLGTRVRILGRTAPGGYSPMVMATRLEQLGPGALPEARKVTLTDLRSGSYNCHRVEIGGVVQRLYRRQSGDNWSLKLELGAPEGLFTVDLLDASGWEREDLVDAEVRIVGTCFNVFNHRGEDLGAYIRCERPEDLHISLAPPTNPFDAPLANTLALQPFSPEGIDRHRQRIRGTVLLFRPGQFLYLEGPHRGYRVDTRETTPVEVGDEVEAVGFVEVNNSFGQLTEAIFRKTGDGRPPEPLPIQRQDVIGAAHQGRLSLRDEDYDGRLVQIEGELLRIETESDGDRELFLDCDGTLTLATLGPEVPAADLAPLVPGSQLRITGVCSVQLNARWPTISTPYPEDLILLMRDRRDIHVLSTPSWWTNQRLIAAIGGVGAAAALLLVWSLSLRHTAQRQARVIAERRVQESRLQERQRIGRDLHDTLQQELTGIGMLLGSARGQLQQPERVRTTLDLAEKMVKRASAECRHSIHDLISVTLEQKGFEAALNDLVKPLAEIQGATFTTEFDRSMPDLSGRTRTALLRIAHEAAANAGRHSGASTIHLSLSHQGDYVILTVKDDGKGFDPTATGDPTKRNFGLLSMEERALKLNGTLTVDSQPGHGTTVTATIPISLTLPLKA